jgi:hypothetical protein
MNGGPELEIDVDSGEASEIAYIWGFLQSKVHIDPKRNPIAFLNALPQAIDATYVFASQVHEDDTCPFLTEPRLPAPSAP